MPSITQTLALLASISLTQALTVTSPSKFELWDSAKTNSIAWSAVSTDPQKFDIYLAHMAAHPPLYSLLFSDVAASTGKVDVSGLQLPNGEAYQINLVAHDNDKQILAQSQQFNVTGEAVKATSTLEGYTGPTYSPTASGTTAGTVSGSASLTTMTRTSTGASGSLTTETSVSTSSAESASTDSASGSGTSSRAASQTVAAASTSSSPAAVKPNGASGNVVASGSLAALFFGVAALLV